MNTFLWPPWIKDDPRFRCENLTIPDPPTSVIEKIDARLQEIDKDDRLQGPPATIDINAPLALIQLSLETERDTLKRVKTWIEEG